MSRWSNYVAAFDDEDAHPERLWAAAAGAGRSAYVLAVGFDPRCLIGLRRFLGVCSDDSPIIVRIELPEGSATPDSTAVQLAAAHNEEFHDLIVGLDVRTVPAPTAKDAANIGVLIARAFGDTGVLDKVRHLLIDISSLPSTVYFPLIRGALAAVDGGEGAPGVFAGGEVQVVAAENPAVDAAITEEAIDEATPVGGFRYDLDLASVPDTRRVWAPVLGEGCGPALEKLFTRLRPDELCPILPFPARNPRRGDGLVLELQQQLFETFEVSPGNVIYAHEANPFDLYRTLGKLQADYVEALKPLGRTEIILSTHSTKLLSLGALLAAYEYALPVVAAASGGHRADPKIRSLTEGTNTVCLWLAGRPYGAR